MVGDADVTDIAGGAGSVGNVDGAAAMGVADDTAARALAALKRYFG